MRGQVFTIDGKILFTFGGTESVDMIYRAEGVSWWTQETPNAKEYEVAIENLAKVGNKVDYVITHAIDKITLRYSTLNKFGFKSS